MQKYDILKVRKLENEFKTLGKVVSKMLATLRGKNQITLPSDIIKALKLNVKDQFECQLNGNGQIILTPIEIVDKKTMDDIKEALLDIKEGRVSEPMTAQQLIEKLGL